MTLEQVSTPLARCIIHYALAIPLTGLGHLGSRVSGKRFRKSILGMSLG